MSEGAHDASPNPPHCSYRCSDEQDLAKICRPATLNERLIDCRNAPLAAEHTRQRSEPLATTEIALAPIISRSPRDGCAARHHRAAGREVINRYKMTKHLQVTSPNHPARRPPPDVEAALDGMLRAAHPASKPRISACPGGRVPYKHLAQVDRDFRTIKVEDLNMRPIHHRLADRVHGHVLIYILAAYAARRVMPSAGM